MQNSKHFSMMLISTIVWLNAASYAQATTPKPTPTHQPLLHVVVINMSGKAREAHVGNTVVPLPVAERVALQIPQGASIQITSSTDRNFTRVFTPALADDGRTIPVDR